MRNEPTRPQADYGEFPRAKAIPNAFVRVSALPRNLPVATIANFREQRLFLMPLSASQLYRVIYQYLLWRIFASNTTSRGALSAHYHSVFWITVCPPRIQGQLLESKLVTYLLIVLLSLAMTVSDNRND